MEAKFNTYYSIILLLFLVTTSILGLMGKIAFGHGLGDLFDIILLWVLTLIYLIYVSLFVIRQKLESITILIFNLVFTFFTIWLCLEATIWRGSEYKWNGELFYNL